MRVLAARFADRRAAWAVREQLQNRMRVAAPDVAIAPLATGFAPSDDETVLAGRFAEHEAAEVAKLVNDAGGEIVANVDERWTVPRQTLNASSWGSSLTKDRLHA